ncbi:SPOR domain-containing protein [Thiorhodospira sibirica]|uniref:SPOR domain-containing protein n=1 Tax=Thiorhodospira sibirica TaxID=154347 RepID=UPI00022C1D40|nr:SPOR domain-containing protein [Thiorhodospira sibirica]
MPRDYKNTVTASSRSRKKSSAALPGWVWGLVGLAGGLVVALIVALQGQSGTPTPGVASQPPMQAPPPVSSYAPPQPPATAPTTRPEAQRPQFEFYTLLPELEVVIPETAPARPAPPPATPPTTPPPAGQTAPPQSTPGGESAAVRPPRETATPATPAAPTPPAAASRERFMLQAGSFRQHQEAERLRARLALLGVEAKIQQVTVNSDTWHRVHIGPFNSRSEVDRVRERLSNNQVQTMLLRLPDSG